MYKDSDQIYTVVTFINYICVLKVNKVIVRPNMVCNVGSFRAALDISNVFFFSS